MQPLPYGPYSHASLNIQANNISGGCSMRNPINPFSGLFRAVGGMIALSFLATPLFAQDDDDDNVTLDEIVVTAQKREQSIFDVPLAISAIGEQEIEAAGIGKMADFFRRVPSLAVIDQGAARKNVIIRGIQTSTSTESRVNDVYLDEQRITTAIATGDPRTFDLERIEVLRGPQGTLFGGGSLGGTIRYITNRANVSEFETNVAASLSSTQDADGTNYSIDAMVNIPIIEDKFAVRLVGYQLEDSGYLKNSLLGLDDVSAIENTGFRIGLRYVPADNMSFDYKYLTQDLKQTGFPESRGPNIDALEQGGVTLTPERLTNKMQMHDLTFSVDFGAATFLSSTGYLQMDFLRRNDNSLPLIRDFLGDDTLTAAEAIAAAPDAIRLFINDDNDNFTFSQEFRLTSNIEEGDKFAWNLGAYYEDGEEDVSVGDFLGAGAGVLLDLGTVNGAPADFFFQEDFTTFLEQTSFFGELTYFFGERIQGTVGYRHSSFESNFKALATIPEEVEPDGTAFIDPFETDPFPEDFDTFKFNLSYSLGDNALLFMQSAEGFRLGFGSEVPPPFDPGCGTFIVDFLTDRGLDGILVDGRLPGTKSDTLWMHEIGIKGTTGNGRAQYSAGIFYGDWQDIQVEVEIEDITGQCNTGFAANLASATSTGVEAEYTYAVSDRITLSGSGSWVDATVDDHPSNEFLGAAGGDRLPGSPDLQLAVSGDYVWPMNNNRSGFVRMDAQYIGEILGAFEFGDERTRSGKYAIGNLRVGMEAEKYQLTLFVDNVTDNRGRVFSNGSNNEFRRTILLRPRTIGLEIRTKF